MRHNQAMADHYRTLQVAREAEQEVIERAYRALSRKYHPDHLPAGDRNEATAKMQTINAAYSVLRDPTKRQAYDRTLVSEDPRIRAWDVFLERGVVGLFVDRLSAWWAKEKA